MKKIKEITDIKKAQRKLAYELRQKMIEKTLEFLGDKDVDNGYSLSEIAGFVLNKQYISHNDKQEIYLILVYIRETSDLLLAYRNKKYGWGKDKETIDNYNLNNINNGAKKIKKAIIRTPKNYTAIGITQNPFLMFNAEFKKFGFNFIEYKSLNSMEETK